MNKQTVTSTVTPSPHKWSKNETEEEIMKFVRYAHNDKDALHNLRLELKAYKKSIKFWELVSLILKK